MNCISNDHFVFLFQANVKQQCVSDCGDLPRCSSMEIVTDVLCQQLSNCLHSLAASSM